MAASALTPSSASATTSIEPLDVNARTTPSRNSGWSSPTTTRTFSTATKESLARQRPIFPRLGTRNSSVTPADRPTATAAPLREIRVITETTRPLERRQPPPRRSRRRPRRHRQHCADRPASPDRGTSDSTGFAAERPTDVTPQLRDSYLNAGEAG